MKPLRYHPLKTAMNKHTKKVLVHISFVLIGLDFVALVFHSELGPFLEPLHEFLSRSGGMAAVAVYYFEAV